MTSISHALVRAPPQSYDIAYKLLIKVKSDIHGIIMNPYNDLSEMQTFVSPHSGKKVIQSSYNTLDKTT